MTHMTVVFKHRGLRATALKDSRIRIRQGRDILGTAPHPVTVYIRGPIEGYIQPYYKFIQLLLGGGNTQEISMTRIGQADQCMIRFKIYGAQFKLSRASCFDAY